MNKGITFFVSAHFHGEVVIYYANTKSLAKEFLEILVFEYRVGGQLKICNDVFFDADSGSPRMMLSKHATLRSYERKTAF